MLEELREILDSRRQARESQQEAVQESEEALQEARSEQIEAAIMDVSINIDNFLDEQYERWMERKHGRKKSLFGAGHLFHAMRRFCAGDYEMRIEIMKKEIQLSKIAGKHKSKLKLGIGLTGLAAGLLGGAGPAVAAIGGAYLARGLVESGKRLYRARKTEGRLEGRQERIGLDRQIELGFLAKKEYARQLAAEVESSSENRDEAYYQALEKMVEFIHRSETDDFKVEYYRLENGEYRAVWAGVGQDEVEAAEKVAEVEMDSLLKGSLKNDRIAGLIESGAGILGGGLAGYLGFVEAKLKAAEELSKQSAGLQADLMRTVRESGARGIKFDKESGRWLVDIAKDRPIPGMPGPVQDYHAISKESERIISFLRSAEEQKFLRSHPELLEGIIRPEGAPDVFTHGLITDPRQIEIAKKVLKAINDHSRAIDNLELHSLKEVAKILKTAVAGAAIPVGQSVMGAVLPILDRAARKEYQQFAGDSKETYEASKQAIDSAREQAGFGAAEEPEGSTAERVEEEKEQAEEMLPEAQAKVQAGAVSESESGPAETKGVDTTVEQGVSLPSGIRREDLTGGSQWQKKRGLAIRERNFYFYGDEVTIVETEFAGDDIKTIQIRKKDGEPVKLDTEDKILKFVNYYEPQKEE
jgi:hypothetical protein